MNPLFPFLGAIFQTVSFTLDKVILSVKKTGYKTYLGLSFPLIFFFDFLIFLVFRPPASLAVFSGIIIFILLARALISIVTNLLYYRALAKDALTELQTLGLLGGLPVIIFSAITFADERNIWIILLATISSLAIIWSHWDHHHFQIKKDTLIFLVWFLLVVPFGAILSKILLATFHSITLMLIQDGAVALILGWFYLKESFKVSSGAILPLLLTNFFSSAGWILYFLSIQQVGIVYTVLLFSLQPLLTYFASLLFLKEKPERKKIFAFVVILLSAAVAQIIRPI